MFIVCYSVKCLGNFSYLVKNSGNNLWNGVQFGVIVCVYVTA
jgi:hypothetical protein